MRRHAFGLSFAATLALLPACKSHDERVRQGIVGVWERAADGNVSFERRFFPNGVYVETRHDPSATLPSEMDVVESGTYRIDRKRLVLGVIESAEVEGAIERESAFGSFDDDDFVVEEAAGPTRWTRRRTALPENLPDATGKATEKARAALSRASGCLVGGRLDAGPAWPRLLAVSRGVALLPSASEAAVAKKLPAWPASCVPALEEARAALDGLFTPEALERCGKLRHVLRATFREKPGTVAAYGRAGSETRRIDAIATEATRCGIAAAPPADATPLDRGRPVQPASPVERGTPIRLPGTMTSGVVRVEAASPSATSVRFITGANAANDGTAFEGAFCATRGGAEVTGIRCEPLRTKADGVLRPLTSLDDDAPLWATQGVNALVRPGQPEVVVRGDFAVGGRAYIDASSVVRGSSSDGTELQVGADGRATEAPGPRPAAPLTARGDLRFLSTDDGFSVSRAGDADPAKLGTTKLTKSYRDIEACFDGQRFGFIAHDDTRILAGVPRLDGSLALVDAEVAADSDRSDQARSITCEPGVIRYLWLSRETRVVRVTCRVDGCNVDRSDPLPDHAPGAIAVAALGDRILLAKLGAIPPAELGLGAQVAYRVADLALLANAPDRVLMAEPDADSPASAAPERFSMVVSAFGTRSAGIIAVPSTSGLYLFRVEAEGAARALSP